MKLYNLLYKKIIKEQFNVLCIFHLLMKVSFKALLKSLL